MTKPKLNKQNIKERIERLHEIYRDFKKELTLLEKEENELVNSILRRLDLEKIENILDQIKNSRYGHEKK